MSRSGTFPLIAALLCFAIFFGNVAAGAAGLGVFLGDVAEMLMLLASTVLVRRSACWSAKRQRDAGEG